MLFLTLEDVLRHREGLAGVQRHCPIHRLGGAHYHLLWTLYPSRLRWTLYHGLVVEPRAACYHRGRRGCWHGGSLRRRGRRHAWFAARSIPIHMLRLRGHWNYQYLKLILRLFYVHLNSIVDTAPRSRRFFIFLLFGQYFYAFV